MAKVIEFYIPRTFHARERYLAAGPATIIVFPSAGILRAGPEGGRNLEAAERRSNPRGGLFARIEDATYNVMRKAQRASSDAKDVDTWDRDCM